MAVGAGVGVAWGAQAARTIENTSKANTNLDFIFKLLFLLMFCLDFV
jgi:hypothetical protein